VLGAAGLSVGMKSCANSEAGSAAAGSVTFRIQDVVSKPPLGWNSFDSYGVYLHHDAAMANLEAMAEKLKPYGYEYFVIDAGWFGEFELVEGTLFPTEKHAKELNFNEYGILQPSKTYFPHGFEPIVKYAHELGLKMGLHLMRGIPRKVVELNLPIKNSKYRAQDIADVNSICLWNHQNYGVDVSKPGAQDFYNSLYAQVAEWGFDFVKVDDLNLYPKEIVAIADAIENCGRRMVYSLSPGGAIYMPDLPYYKRGNMLRNTVDIWDRREDINKGFVAWKKFQGIAHEGFYPDLDMIPFGKLQLMSPEKYADGTDSVDLAGLGNTRQSNLTPAQMRTFITMRSLAASPLMLGGDMPTLDDYSLDLLTNREMLACNQNGECGINVYEEDGVEVWITNEKNRPGNGWIGIFNRNEHDVSVELNRRELGLLKFKPGNKLVPTEAALDIFEVWTGKSFSLGEIFTTVIEADDVVFMRFQEA
jgi:hypothetical protein